MSYCGQCGAGLASGAKFCSACGAAIDSSGGISQTVGKGNRGTVIQAAAGSTVHHGAPAEKPVAMDARWAWNSPLTQSALAWIGTGLSLLSLVPFAKIVEPLWQIFTAGRPSSEPGWGTFGWFVGFTTTMLLAALTWSAFNVVRRRQVRPLDRFGLLPAAWGREGRLGLARLSGTCPHCGGNLRLKSIATAFRIEANGKERPSMREPFAVCANNPEQHRFAFDTTATIEQVGDPA